MQKVIHGDYQTPSPLAHEVAQLVRRRLPFEPHLVVEPTCGEGSIAIAAAQAFPAARVAGYELDVGKVEQLQASPALPSNLTATVANFFEVDWPSQLTAERCLVVGNPPWVAVSRLGELGSTNRPAVSLKLGHSGIENKLGASNYDIAEYMTLVLAACLVGKSQGAVALLLKATAVRRLAVQLQSIRATDLHFFRIDGRKHFNVSVPCGLLYFDFQVSGDEPTYFEYEFFDAEAPSRQLAIRGRQLVAPAAGVTPFIVGQKFRSGVKHDAAEVLELSVDNGVFRNKRGELVDLPEAAVFPLLKSAGLGQTPAKALVVPHSGLASYAGADQMPLEQLPHYLEQNRAVFDRRKSSVYTKLGEFAVFGIGPYSFQPWKVAISAFSKTPNFSVVGPYGGRPVLFDDTVYFVAFDTREAAEQAYSSLMRDEAQAALAARMFKEDMRSVKAKVLNDLFCLA
jgi:hypothetical protein